MKNSTYKIDGMTCEGCVRAVTRALEAANARDVVVDLEAGTVRVGSLAEDGVRQVVEDAGFDFGGAVV